MDLVVNNGFITHVEVVWEHEPSARWLEGLASFARVITFDRRGSGMSDPVAGAPALEVRMDDVRAVMDAVGSSRAALLGISEGAPMSILFAATYPERVQALVLLGGMARSTWAQDYPWGSRSEDLIASAKEFLAPHWGEGAMVDLSAPSRGGDPEIRTFFGRMERSTGSPGMVAQLNRMFLDIDVRDLVPTVHAPALVLHRRHDRFVNIGNGRWLAEHLPDARFVVLEGSDHIRLVRGPRDNARRDRGVPHRDPLASRAPARAGDRPVHRHRGLDATAASVGDARWRSVLEGHHRTVQAALSRFGGREVKSTGDGLMATFDGPARAIRCAKDIVGLGRARGIQIRAGVHTGECELLGDDDIGGIAVHIAARVSALADPDEVLVSRTVRDLVAGSGLEFTPRGTHELRGVPDSWELYAADGG